MHMNKETVNFLLDASVISHENCNVDKDKSYKDTNIQDYPILKAMI